ncbi:MAG: LysM peptidoglycan-binding domain-containing protein [Candidatus Eisenbacteria bacterium]|nr:LysM peptidoglycan-binding domain-containing protein [Candidatus Eisenbacteria bacterium]
MKIFVCAVVLLLGSVPFLSSQIAAQPAAAAGPSLSSEKNVYGPPRRESERYEPSMGPPPPDSTYIGSSELLFVPEVNEKVLAWIDYFTGGGRKVFERYLARSGRYMNLMADILTSEGIPSDLAALVFVESGFNVHARSWAHAVGPWQFIKGTARLFDLTMNSWVDERRDPVKSTVAAAKYLKHLYELFQSWPLAVASYNTGENNVLSAMRRHGTSDFWSLRRLPRQTREYVPQFMAALILSKNPSQYGFNVQYDDPLEFDEIAVGGLVDLKTVASICDVPLEAIKALNPGLLRQRTPPGASGVTLRVPPGTGELCLARLASIPPSPVPSDEPKTKAGKYVVRKGDTLSGIAAELGVSLSALRRANHLGESSMIKAGGVLSIPGSKNAASPAVGPSRDSSPSSGSFEYKVRRGDTLYGLSRRFGVSLDELLKTNGFSKNHKLAIGETVTVPGHMNISMGGASRKDSKDSLHPSAPQLQ